MPTPEWCSAASSHLLCDPDVVLEQGKGWEFCGLTYGDPSGTDGQSEPS